jgi:hypothetical protein
VFEIYDTQGLLAGTLYDPATAVSTATTSNLAMTALDTTNLRLTFNAPGSGKVWVRIRCATSGATTYPMILLGVLDGATVKGRVSPFGGVLGTGVSSTRVGQDAGFLVTGLTGGTSYTWDAAYGVEVTVASTGIKYGGPNNTTTNDAWGGVVFEVWDADYAPVFLGDLGLARAPRNPGINHQNPAFV